MAMLFYVPSANQPIQFTNSFTPIYDLDDGYWRGPNIFANNETKLNLGSVLPGGFFVRCNYIPISNAAVIDDCSVTTTTRANGSDVTFKYYFNAVDSATAPTSYAECLALIKTTNYADFTYTSTHPSTVTATGLKDALQEVVDRGGWQSGNALMVVAVVQSYTGRIEWQPKEASQGLYIPKLNVTYTQVPTPATKIGKLDADTASEREGWIFESTPLGAGVMGSKWVWAPIATYNMEGYFVDGASTSAVVTSEMFKLDDAAKYLRLFYKHNTTVDHYVQVIDATDDSVLEQGAWSADGDYYERDLDVSSHTGKYVKIRANSRPTTYLGVRNIRIVDASGNTLAPFVY